MNITVLSFYLQNYVCVHFTQLFFDHMESETISFSYGFIAQQFVTYDT